MSRATLDIDKEVSTEYLELGTYQYMPSLGVQVEWSGMVSPTGTLKLVTKQREATQYAEIRGLTADISDYDNGGTGTVIFEELCFLGEDIAVEYTRGDETTGTLTAYLALKK